MSTAPTGERFVRAVASSPGAAPAAGRHGSPAAPRETRVVALGGGRPVIAPDPEVPHWREADGTRHSYGTLRLGLALCPAAELRGAHLEAIGRLAAAALEAAERGERSESARLACAAGRLCGEIRGHWPPSAVATRGP